ncbi:MAG TPA: hypothetical protein VFU87_02045 [Sphingomicrobium sp.]|nr:hypothetical protein [Sphingomicrobium sp.]
MQQAVSARTPAHLWIVGILSLLWNCWGAYDYIMTRMRNVDYLGQMGDANQILAWVEGFPLYAQIGWGLGVWMALLGAVLLLMRSRWAVWAFAISLVGMAMSFSYMFFGPPMPGAEEAGMMKYMPIAIVLLGLAQLYYAYRQEKAGVLR